MKLTKLFGKEKRRGAAIAETAIVLPILIVLCFGAIKYGWLFYRLQQVTNVTRQAARYAIRPGVTSAAQVETRIETLMTEAGLAGKYDPPVVTLTSVSGDPVTVEISVPTVNVDLLNFDGPIIIIPAPQNLSASVTMSKEGPGGS